MAWGISRSLPTSASGEASGLALASGSSSVPLIPPLSPDPHDPPSLSDFHPLSSSRSAPSSPSSSSLLSLPDPVNIVLALPFLPTKKHYISKNLMGAALAHSLPSSLAVNCSQSLIQNNPQITVPLSTIPLQPNFTASSSPSIIFFESTPDVASNLLLKSLKSSQSSGPSNSSIHVHPPHSSIPPPPPSQPPNSYQGKSHNQPPPKYSTNHTWQQS